MTRNIQNTSNNRGIGEIGNLSNIQVGGKEDYTPPLPRKKKDFMVIAISMSCIFSIASVLYLMFCGINSHGGESLLLSSLVISIIGVIATIVVIGNYAQVRDIENKFRQEVSLVKENYSVQIKAMEREIEVQMGALKIDLQKEMNITLLQREVSSIIRAFYIDDGLFDDWRREYFLRKTENGEERSEYYGSFLEEIERCFSVLETIFSLKNEYDVEIDIEKEVCKILSYLKRILQYIKDYSLAVFLEECNISKYIELLRKSSDVPRNDLLFIAPKIEELKSPPTLSLFDSL